MSKYKRAWAVLGVVGMLCALLALSVASPTTAGADTGPDNHVNFLKVVQGTFDGNAAAGFTLEVSCQDPDPTVVEQPGGGNPNVPFLQSVVVAQLVGQHRRSTSLRGTSTASSTK